MNRRDILVALAGTTLGGGLASCGRPAEKELPGKHAPVGLQLYTVRDHMAADLPGTLQRVAKLGYQEVEFAGYFDYSPPDLVAILRDAGLAAPATHVSMVAIRDTPEQVIETSLGIGHEFVVVSSVPVEERESLDDFRRNADTFNNFAERCGDAGLQFAYHNHAFEFERQDDVIPMDLLLERTDPALVNFELDLYWIIKGGADPLAYFRKYPGRFPLCHVKDMAADGSITDVGKGQIDFAAIFAEHELAGLRHYFVERDDPQDSMASAETSCTALTRLVPAA